MIRTRFAPSPNGLLHLGHAWSAIVAHDLARAAGGEFLLRIEDIDAARSRPGLSGEIFADLDWLGLQHDGVAVIQSERTRHYVQACDTLRAQGLLYPCCCTRSEIAAAATRHGPDGPIYPGTCRGRKIDPAGAAWRLDMTKAIEIAQVQTGTALMWDDTLAGPQIATPEIFGDVVLLRKEGAASYHLAATIDDAAQGITLVTRGADLFAASHLHRLLQALLGLAVPRWHHHALLIDADGHKLAKRRGSPALADRRHAGEDGLALAAALRAGHLPTGISLARA